METEFPGLEFLASARDEGGLLHHVPSDFADLIQERAALAVGAAQRSPEIDQAEAALFAHGDLLENGQQGPIVLRRVEEHGIAFEDGASIDHRLGGLGYALEDGGLIIARAILLGRFPRGIVAAETQLPAAL